MNDKFQIRLSEFKKFCRDNHITQAILKGIPYIGEPINEVLYGAKDDEQFIRAVDKFRDQQEEILAKVNEIEEKHRLQNSGYKTIVAIGGGNAEYLYISNHAVSLGQKNPIAEVRELVGGGGVNFSARLLATGHNVYPILTVGDDRTGRMIQLQLNSYAQEAYTSDEVKKFINSQNFFVRGMKSSSSTILVQPGNRTIFAYNTEGDADSFRNFLKKRLHDVEQITGKKPDAIRISHINRFSNTENIQVEGGIIQDIIQTYRKKALLFVNLGASQLSLGLKYWEESLKDVDVVQLNLHEAKRLFSQNEESITLSDIIKWFRERGISAVITLAKFGAVGTFKTGREGIAFAWPLEVQNYVDPTGAGDAFSAGMVSALVQSNKEFAFSDYYSAIDKGRYWASYACTTYGGCGECPSMDELESKSIEMRKSIKKNQGHEEPIEIFRHEHSENILKLIDKAYS